MSRLDRIRIALEPVAVDVTGLVARRPNELHCIVPSSHVWDVAAVALRELGADLVLMAADDRRRASDAFFVHYLFAHQREDWFLHVTARLDDAQPGLTSLAQACYPASRFEREIRDLFGIALAGHPDPGPLVKHGFWPADYYPLRKDARDPAFRDDGQPFPFTQVGGEGVYEIPVGPVHAGVIEPGHFRFSVMGETVINLRTRLYFTHKGMERLFEGRSAREGVELAERISGDTSVGHALAYCQAIEAAAHVDVPPRAAFLRVVLLELERLYNHVGDFGAIVGDTGFGLAHAHCYRIREHLFRLNKQFTGSRLLRGVVAPGGLVSDLCLPDDLVARITKTVVDFEEVVAISLRNTLVMDRLEGTGVLTRQLAKDHGVLGYVARASGLDLDARRDHGGAAYRQLDFRVPVFTAGDVKARVDVRLEEIRESVKLIDQASRLLPSGPVHVSLPRLQPFVGAFGIVEGWRGRIAHWVMTEEDGALHRVKVVDPSFFNWPALSYALEGNIVPDFPLCNKSFNQSYSGNDL